jgi:hypothetical protein
MKRRKQKYENRELMRIFGPRTEEGTGAWKTYNMRSFIICTVHHVQSRRMNWVNM